MYSLQRLILNIEKFRCNSNLISWCKYNWGKITTGTQTKYISSLSNSELRPYLLYNLMHRPASVFYLQRKHFSKIMPNAGEEFRHLDYEQLMKFRSEQKNCLIDVREKYELDETGVIPGAFHIPLGDIGQALTTPDEQFINIYKFPKPAPDDNIIFSCRSGKRSLVALEKALAVGFTNARHYKGGWLDWEKNTSPPK